MRSASTLTSPLKTSIRLNVCRKFSRHSHSRVTATLRAYAEVLGTSGSEKKAAAWIGGLVEVTNGVVSLELNLDWLQLAGVSGPLYLQNVYLSDATTSFPVSIYSGEIQVAKSEGLPRHWAAAANTNISITTEMREGVNPLQKGMLKFIYASTQGNDDLAYNGTINNDK